MKINILVAKDKGKLDGEFVCASNSVQVGALNQLVSVL